MTITRTNPEGLSAPGGYSHIVASDRGRLIFISGQVALNPRGEVVGEGDLRAQARQVYENLRVALAAAGATFADVVKQTTFIVDYRPEFRNVIADVRREFLGVDALPASTLVGVQALARPEFLIEVEVIAAAD